MSSLRLVHIELTVANAFVESLHRHHKPVQGHRFSVGVELDGVLVGVAICGRPSGGHGEHNQDTVEVTRLCTNGAHNACSYLYGACARAAKALGYKYIQTYILEAELGTSLKASNWRLLGTSSPSTFDKYRTDGATRKADGLGVKQRWGLNLA